MLASYAMDFDEDCFGFAISGKSYFYDNHKQLKENTIGRIRRDVINALNNEKDATIEEKMKLLLHEASYHAECNDLVKELLKSNIDPNSEYLFGYPLNNACSSGSFENVKILLKYKANPNLGSSLVIASKKGHLEIVQLLLKHKMINIDIKDAFGDTALTGIFSQYAEIKIENARKALILMLLQAGANPFIKNTNKQDAISLAKKKGLNEIAELMKNFWRFPKGI